MSRAIINESVMHKTRAANATVTPAVRRLTFVAPRHREGVDWPWISRVGPMRRFRFKPVYIENTCERLPKATRADVQWQYLRAMREISKADLAFLFSTDIGIGMTAWPSRLWRQPTRVYVGFTQDGDWPMHKVDRLGFALRQVQAVTVFSGEERRLYINRYGLERSRVHVVPIHTDETQGYSQYSDVSPVAGPYVLSMGSPNRRFMPVARACRALKIPLIIITRPTHANDSLHDLADMGATIITNAGKQQALTYLKHARLGAMVFQTPALPGAFTTLIHAMYLRTPCVASACLGISDYVVDGSTGFVVPHGDEDSLAAAIGRLWNDAALAERFADAGLDRAQRNFSLEAAAQRFHDLTEQLLRQDASAN